MFGCRLIEGNILSLGIYIFLHIPPLYYVFIMCFNHQLPFWHHTLGGICYTYILPPYRLIENLLILSCWSIAPQLRFPSLLGPGLSLQSYQGVTITLWSHLASLTMSIQPSLVTPCNTIGERTSQFLSRIGNIWGDEYEIITILRIMILGTRTSSLWFHQVLGS